MSGVEGNRHIIFIHGQGPTAGHHHEWLQAMQFGLQVAGRPEELGTLQSLTVRPSYAPYLDGAVPPGEHVDTTAQRSFPDEATEAYGRCLADVRNRIGRGFPSDARARAVGFSSKTRMTDAALRATFPDVHRYLKDPTRRFRIRAEVRKQLPKGLGNYNVVI